MKSDCCDAETVKAFYRCGACQRVCDVTVEPTHSPKLTPEQIAAIRWPSVVESELECAQDADAYEKHGGGMSYAERTCYECGWTACLDWAINYALRDLMPKETYQGRKSYVD